MRILRKKARVLNCDKDDCNSAMIRLQDIRLKKYKNKFVTVIIEYTPVKKVKKAKKVKRR